MRPLNNPKKRPNQDFAKQVWDAAAKNDAIERIEEQEVFHLSQKEANKCRFEMVDNTQRIAECTVHTQNFTHGVRLHPPHLWRLEDGIVYHRYSMQGEWVRWSPVIKENQTRFQ